MYCKDCAHWKRNEGYVGYCDNEKFAEIDWDVSTNIPTDFLYYYGGYSTGFQTGETFGCIHFKSKE